MAHQRPLDVVSSAPHGMLCAVSQWTPKYSEDQRGAVVAACLDRPEPRFSARRAGILLNEGRLTREGDTCEPGYGVPAPSGPMPANTAADIVRQERRRRKGLVPKPRKPAPPPGDMATIEDIALRTVSLQWQRLEKEGRRTRLDPKRVAELAKATQQVKALVAAPGKGATRSAEQPNGTEQDTPPNAKPKGLLDQLADRMSDTGESDSADAAEADRAETPNPPPNGTRERGNGGATGRTGDESGAESKTETRGLGQVSSRVQETGDDVRLTGRARVELEAPHLASWRRPDSGGSVAPSVTDPPQSTQ